MPLKVEPVASEDWEVLKKFVRSKQGILTSPAADIGMAVTDDESGEQLNLWSLEQQKAFFTSDPSAHTMKCVDTDRDNEIIAVARWHFYPSGYEASNLEYAGLKPPTEDSSYPLGFNFKFYYFVLSELFAGRRAWMGNGPQWVLTTLKTRDSERKRGAGTMLIQWGTDKAKENNCPAFLEAAAGALSLYEKLGFKKQGDIKLDTTPYGGPPELVLTKMRFDP